MTRHAFSHAQCRAGGAKPDLAKRAALMLIVERNGGNIAKAARELGISKSTVRSAVKRARGYKVERKPAPVRLPVIVVPAVNGVGLVADRRAETAERRRFDCVKLDVCGDAWIERRGAAQGMCPDACAGYEREARR